MKKKAVYLLVVFTSALTVTFAIAKHHTPEDRGMSHFNNPQFAGGKRSCNSCHPNGKGLEGAGTKSNFAIMGGQQGSLEQAVNICIVNANKGNALGVDSAEMQEVISYIKSLGK
jgi:cytochrome c